MFVNAHTHYHKCMVPYSFVSLKVTVCKMAIVLFLSSVIVIRTTIDIYNHMPLMTGIEALRGNRHIRWHHHKQ